MKEQHIFGLGPVSILLLFATFGVVGCGNYKYVYGTSTASAVQPLSIQNINSSTMPISPVGFPIAINGSSFQSTPGKVNFAQGAVSVDVVPESSSWSDAGVVAVVPNTAGFTVPGTVSVTVVTSMGTSNTVALGLVSMTGFSPSTMHWGTTMALPTAMTGLRAVAVPGSTTGTAFAVVTGGFNGSANTTTVWSNNLNADGTVGNKTNTSWTTIATSPLPDTRAHHAMAEADPTNSLVPIGKAYVYVIGGQKMNTDTPGGTNTVYMAGVDPMTGAVGTGNMNTPFPNAWTALPNTLPQALLGASATVYGGYLFVAGGLTAGGLPSNAVYSAPVNSDGTIGMWTTSPNPLPPTVAASFAEMFSFGGRIYFIDGDTANSTNPNTQAVGTKNVYYASVLSGIVGMWTVNPTLTIQNRSKGIVYTAFGQVISAEGIYNGNATAGEFEFSAIQSDGTLGTFTALTCDNIPSALVYNAGAFTSPLVSLTGGPRFLIFGGQAFTATSGPGGALSNVVHYNPAP